MKIGSNFSYIGSYKEQGVKARFTNSLANCEIDYFVSTNPVSLKRL